MRATKLGLILVLHLIGRESDASFFGPIIEQSRVKPVQTQITLETQLKVTLLMVFESLI